MNDSIYHHLTEEQLERDQELDEEMYKIEIRLKKIERERRKINKVIMLESLSNGIN